MTHSKPQLQRRLLKTTLALAIATVTASLHAEGTTGSSRATALEEVTVTAQKREESLQQAPLAVSAFSADFLENMGIDNTADIAIHTPNVGVAESLAGNATPIFSVRGISTVDASNFALDSALGLYVDGVAVGRSSGALFDMVDVERIEVLRGPQGTLYGRNTTGGAINLIAAKPTGELGFKQTLSLGNRGLFNSKTTINTPKINGFSSRLSYMSSEQDGPVGNNYSGNASNAGGVGVEGEAVAATLGGRETDAYRIALRWEGDTALVDYTYDHNEYAGTPLAQQLLYTTGYATVLSDISVDSSERQGSLSLNNASAQTSTTKGHSLALSWDLQSFTVKSLSAYRKLYAQGAKDLDGGNWVSPVYGGIDFAIFETSASPKSHSQFSQEFQLLGTGLDERLDYVGGLYYFHEKGQSIGGTIAFGRDRPGQLNIENFSKALYGQATYTPDLLEDKLSVTVGLRHTLDTRRALTDEFDTGMLENDWSHSDGSLTLDYQWHESMNTYLRVATAYKSGGFNGRADTEVDFRDSFDQEEIIAFELGLKSEWLDSRLRLNAALFLNDYTDMQIDQSVVSAAGASSKLVNAGSATTRGFELEMIAVPVEGLTLSLNYGFLDPEYGELITGIDETSGAVTDQAGEASFAYSPRHSYSFDARYEFAPMSIGELSFNINYAYTDDQTFTKLPSDTALAEVLVNGAGDYDLINARLSLANIPLLNNGELKASLWGKNLGNSEYFVHGTDQLDGLGVMTASFGETRSYGLDVTYQF